jgi:hypothetical protein
LVFGHDLRLEAAMPIPRDFYGQLAEVAFERLFALAVAG